MENVQSWKAKVVNGRLVLDEETDLPDGTELELVLADVVVDDLSESEKEELRLSLGGPTIPAREVIEGLRQR